MQKIIPYETCKLPYAFGPYFVDWIVIFGPSTPLPDKNIKETTNYNKIPKCVLEIIPLLKLSGYCNINTHVYQKMSHSKL